MARDYFLPRRDGDSGDLVAGVDGCAPKVAAKIIDQNRSDRGRGFCRGMVKFQRGNEKRVGDALEGGIINAFREGGNTDPSRVVGVVVAVADINDGDRHYLESVLERRWPFGAIDVLAVLDEQAAMYSIAMSGPAMWIRSGSRDREYARDGRGNDIRGDGFGLATRLAADGLAETFASIKGYRPATSLADRLADYFGANGSMELSDEFGFYNETERVQTLEHILPLIVEVADEGDKLANELVIRTGRSYAESASAMARRLGISQSAFPIGLSGKLWTVGGNLLKNAFLEEVRRTAHAAYLVDDVKIEDAAALMALDRLA